LGSCTSRTDPGRDAFPNHAALAVNASGIPVPGSPGVQRVPVIGPLPVIQDVDREIWGFDTRYVDSDTSIPGGAAGHAVVNPRATWPMMSYCKQGSAQGRWVSAWNYENLIGLIANPSSEGSGNNGGDADYLLLGGVLSADGTSFLTRNTIEFSGNPYLLDSVGSFRAVLRDSAGNELAGTNFQPTRGTFDGPIPDEDEQTQLVTIILPKPDVPVAEIAFLNDGVEISRIVASHYPPTVSILKPTPATLLDTERVTFEWFGFDADGDDLTYTVQYSPDNGNSWKPLVVDHTASTFTIDRSSLTASESALISVAVSDGVNTAVAVSDPFRVADNPPVISIYQPGTDGLSLDSLQSVTLKAFTLDSEDGMLPGAAIAWYSDLNGLLGTGQSLVVPLTDLTEGVHLVTATATDSASGTASDSVTFGVAISDDSNTAWIVDLLNILDQGVFKAKGHRVAILAHLEAIEKAIVNGNLTSALHKLDNLIGHSDECASELSQPGKNDWFTQCDAQQQFNRQVVFLRAQLAH